VEVMMVILFFLSSMVVRATVYSTVKSCKKGEEKWKSSMVVLSLLLLMVEMVTAYSTMKLSLKLRRKVVVVDGDAIIVVINGGNGGGILDNEIG